MRPKWIRPTKISHVALRVRDLQRSAAFYCQLFALERRPAEPPGDDVCICTSRTAATTPAFGIVLIQGLPEGAEPVGMDHLSLEVEKPEDVEDIFYAAAARGAEATEPRQYGGYYQTFIFDPDGHKIEVVSVELPRCGDVQLFEKHNGETQRTQDLSPFRASGPHDAGAASGAADARGFRGGGGTVRSASRPRKECDDAQTL